MSDGAIEYVRSAVLPAALSMLPPRMDSLEARAILLGIGMQESRFKYRQQFKGPAISFWQGEKSGGFKLILDHPATGAIARDVLQRMAYEFEPAYLAALENNDILACIAARLLLWTHPSPLPEGDPNAAWLYYLATWRPGKPHRETWDAFYLDAWAREVNA